MTKYIKVYIMINRKGEKSMDILIEIYKVFLEQSKKQCEEKEKKLILEDRKDDANFERIKQNVYGILETFLNQMNKEKNLNLEEDSTDNFIKYYLKRIEEVENPWKAKLELAKKQNNTEDIVVEEIKLSIIKQVKEQFFKKLENL